MVVCAIGKEGALAHARIDPREVGMQRKWDKWDWLWFAMCTAGAILIFGVFVGCARMPDMAPNPTATVWSPPPTATATPAPKYTGVMAGVVRLEQQGLNGTGFFLTEDIIVTNAHVLERERRGTLYAAMKVYPANGGKYVAERIGVHGTLDLAYLRIRKVPPNTSPIPVGHLRVDMDVRHIGYPRIDGLPAVTPQVAKGSVVGVVGGEWESTATVWSGFSGGPMVDDAGRVVGVTARGAKGQPAQGISIHAVIQDLKRKGLME